MGGLGAFGVLVFFLKLVSYFDCVSSVFLGTFHTVALSFLVIHMMTGRGIVFKDSKVQVYSKVFDLIYRTEKVGRGKFSSPLSGWLEDLSRVTLESLSERYDHLA